MNEFKKITNNQINVTYRTPQVYFLTASWHSSLTILPYNSTFEIIPNILGITKDRNIQIDRKKKEINDIL